MDAKIFLQIKKPSHKQQRGILQNAYLGSEVRGYREPIRRLPAVPGTHAPLNVKGADVQVEAGRGHPAQQRGGVRDGQDSWGAGGIWMPGRGAPGLDSAVVGG